MDTKRTARAAVMTALCFLFLYGSAVLPTAKAAAFVLASASVCITTVECGRKAALISGAAAAVLGLLLLPNKFTALAFAAFFWYYPVLKAVIETRKNLKKEILYKALLLTGAVLLAGVLWRMTGGAALPLYIYPLGLAAGFLYDFVLTLIISAYSRYFPKHGKHS